MACYSAVAAMVRRVKATDVLSIAVSLLFLAACVSCAPVAPAQANGHDGVFSWLGTTSTEQRQRLSDLTGKASFIVWLFAQSPQLYENYKNSSCDGLSFVFLAQWMAGDVTNLVGSVLTGQLPFQIAIATYFCCIDACILVQYYYYWHRDQRLARRQGRQGHLVAGNARRRLLSRSTSSAHHARHIVNLPARDMAMSDSISSLASSQHSLLLSRQRRLLDGVQQSRDPSASTGITKHSRAASRDAISARMGRTGIERPLLNSPHQSYRALEEAAKSVAELAHEAEVTAARREARHRRMQDSLLNQARAQTKSKQRQSADSTEHTDEEDDEVPAHMHASVASLASRRSSSEESSFPFGVTSVPNLRFTSMTNTVAPTRPLSPSRSIGGSRRGRDMSRTVDALRSPAAAATERQQVPAMQRPVTSRSSTRSAQRGASLARRNTGLVFLGMAALFTFGQDAPTTHLQTARSYTSRSAMLQMGHIIGAERSVDPSRHKVTSLDQLTYVAELDSTLPDSHDHLPPPEYSHAPPTWDMLVGRISAWTCALLYITSRMPQIWTNMQRRSVQGLSILLFIAAATGNLLYTISVLVNPKASVPPSLPQARFAFLLESLPFLLGSGGTLIFDAIIVAQWLAWRGKEPSIQGYYDGGQDGAVHAVAGEPMSHSTTHDSQAVSHRSVSRPRGTSRWQSLERQPLLGPGHTPVEHQ